MLKERLKTQGKALLAGTSHNVLAVVLIATAVALGSWIQPRFGGCTPELRQDVINGQFVLLADNVVDAEKVAGDAIVDGPRCGCAHALMAEVHLKRMSEARARRQHVVANQSRQACYFHASQARKFGSTSTRNAAIVRACKAHVA